MFGLDATMMEFLVTAMAGLTALFAMATVWFGMVEKNPGVARARALAQRREKLRSAYTEPQKNRTRAQMNAMPGSWIAQRIRRANRDRAQEIRRKLAQAGWRSDEAFNRFVLAKMFLPLLLTMITALSVYDGEATGPAAAQKHLYVMAAAILGYLGPDIFVKNQVQKREQALKLQLPDALDLLVICAQAGLSLDAALSRVAHEMRGAGPDIADELGLTAIELSFLPERRSALQHLSERVALAEIRSLVGTLIQTERYGTPVSRSLKILVDQFRHERLMRAEEKAAKLPATMTVPMILFIMPCLFIVLAGPAFMRLSEAFATM